MHFRVFTVATVAFLLTGALLASVTPEVTALGAHPTSSSCHGSGAKRCPTSSPTATASATTSTSSTTTASTSSSTTTTTTTTTTTSTSTTTSSPTTTTTTSTTTTTAACAGAALTSQSQVQPGTSYCGGVDVGHQIVLANGDSWTGGDVSGVSAGSQQGAVECPSNCTLVNMYIHGNPNAFAGIDRAGGDQTNVSITGGRVTGTGSLGIGGGSIDGLTIRGVEIDHNGASADCGFEGGGFKGGDTLNMHFTNNYVHDNNCMGVWLDINSASNEIDHNRIDNNVDGGVFYEISQDATIHDNEVSGNGSGACGWLWGAGIGIASSFNIQVYGNTLTGNCNGVGETQQNRTDSTPPAHLLENVDVHNNSVNGTSGARTGAVEDNGTNLSSRNLTWSADTFSNGATFCGLSC
jgi:parallel beta-helix repeat protein